MLRLAQFAEPPETDAVPLAALGLSCALGGRMVLRGIDLSVAAGDAVAVLGTNGSGKTTLLKCLTGRLRATSGEVRWFGRSACGAVASRRLIGFAGHEVALYPELTAAENLGFAARMYALPRPSQRAEESLRRVGLSRHAGQLAGRLSRGMQQRVAIARAVIHEPPIVILDEPFTSLDADGRGWLEDWLTEQRVLGRTLIWSSHDVEQSQRLATRRLELRDKSLIEVTHQHVPPLRRSA